MHCEERVDICNNNCPDYRLGFPELVGSQDLRIGFSEILAVRPGRLDLREDIVSCGPLQPWAILR